jgi:hypothetical protein
LMESLQEILNRAFDLVQIEVQEANLLPPVYHKALHTLVSAPWTGRDLYYTNSSIITQDKAEADALLAFPGCELLFKFESAHFEFGFFFVSVIENKKLFGMISGITPPRVGSGKAQDV